MQEAGPHKIYMAQQNAAPVALVSSSQTKKKSVLAHLNNGSPIQLSNQNMPGIGGVGSSYKRIVNIYSMQNYKKKVKSMAPEARMHLNHSMVPPGAMPYEEMLKKQASMESLQLPELPTKGTSAMNQY